MSVYGHGAAQLALNFFHALPELLHLVDQLFPLTHQVRAALLSDWLPDLTPEMVEFAICQGRPDEFSPSRLLELLRGQDHQAVGDGVAAGQCLLGEAPLVHGGRHHPQSVRHMRPNGSIVETIRSNSPCSSFSLARMRYLPIVRN